MINPILLGLVESVLGKSNPTARGNHSFNCPFCHHKNPKLEVNLVPNKKNENLWHCWVCDAKGKSLFGLFKRIKVSKEKYNQLEEILGTTQKHDTIVADAKVELPKEYKPLYNLTKSDIHARHALAYLRKRGLTTIDILKYQIGYCETGRYANKIIIPTYNELGALDYFVARSFEKEPSRKYDAPSSDKNIIGFESMINWNVPIVLCEGAFDAIAIKRNAIPLFGKNISKKLMQKLVTTEVRKVYLALDKDAIKSTYKIAEQLLKAGKKLFVVDLDDKDPADMGFELFTNKIQQAQPFTFSSLLNLKLSL
jgi:DNA primase